MSQDGQPQGRSANENGAALAAAARRKEATSPELLRSGPQRLVALGSGVGTLRDLVRLRRLRASPALRDAATTA